MFKLNGIDKIVCLFQLKKFRRECFYHKDILMSLKYGTNYILILKFIK
jgi:hypothetical protein